MSEPPISFPNDYGYDIECYPNVFTLRVTNVVFGDHFFFEISDWKNDSAAIMGFLDWLRSNGARLVGFNNIAYDYPMLDFFIAMFQAQEYVTAAQLYGKSQQIFASQDDRFGMTIPKWKWHVDQLDLRLIHHFDNRAKMTGLKSLQYNMRSKSIEDLPFPPGTTLTREQIDDVLIPYNGHDVDETIAFYRHSLKMIESRRELTERYGIDFTNFNDTKIGKRYFIMRLEEASPGICYTKVNGRREARQTHRRSIPLSDIIFPYIAFQHPELMRVLAYLKSTTLYTTFQPPELANLNAVIDGFQFDLGAGGIHGSLSNAATYADDDHELLSIDVKSYYPNLAIKNRAYPHHLSELFCDIYEDLYDQRAKTDKKSSENAMLKLALNGVYGDSREPHSPFLDAAYTMTITINGQLLLCMLAEQMLRSDLIKIIEINTDGMTLRVHKSARGWFDSVYAWWQQLTGLELETTQYSAMFQRDVNSYLSVGVDGKVKRKGAYQWDTSEPNNISISLGWHQDWSSLVVQKAVQARLVDNVPIEKFIAEHDDPFDFMLKAKVPRTSRLTTHDPPIRDLFHPLVDRYDPLPNIARYHIANTGPYLFKFMPPLPKSVSREERKMSISKGWRVNICNRAEHFDWSNLNRSYYVEEAYKLVGMIDNG